MKLASFEALCQQARTRWDALHHHSKPRITVGTATCGRSAGAIDVLKAVNSSLRRHGLVCTVTEVGCTGLCYAEPIVTIFPPGSPGILYGLVTPQRAQELIEQCLLRNQPPVEGALGVLGDVPLGDIPPLWQMPVMRRQVRRVLGNCGLLDPTNIEHYLANGGYSGLVKALQMTPEEIIDEVRRAGLRGRGGAGFPTWRKWQLTRQASGDQKFIVCNGSEGDPGAFSNKLLMESDPHLVLEGMLIAGLAVGAEDGYLYCPAEYALALERLDRAVSDMENNGLLGESILGSPFGFRIKIKQGAGAYVCGEETALLESIEGKRGTPRLRPPFPTTAGLWGLPTVVNNVETLACVAMIFRHDAEWFSAMGTSGSSGTKLYCLSGNVRRSGVVEAAFGITLRELIYDIGGGIPDDKPLRAVAVGGPGGGCLPPALLDRPIDQDSLVELGAALGSGGVVVIDGDQCMVQLARNTVDFACRESCGRCVPCRLGMPQLRLILTDIAEGRGDAGDIELLLELCQGVKLGSLCGLGQTTPSFVLSTLRYFREEYEAHVLQKRCPAGRCSMAVSACLSPTG